MSQSKHKFNRNFAVIVGINNYNNGIPALQTAVPDAKKLAEILESNERNENDKYHVIKLLDNLANFDGLNGLLEGFKQDNPTIYLPDGSTYNIEKDDRLLFYFAGHGLILKDVLEDKGDWDGYLVPQNATGSVLAETDIEKIKKVLLPMQDLHDAITKLPCRHVMVILDCCFAGAFRSTLSRDIVASRKVYKERYERFIDSPAWQVITSASHDQKAVDAFGRFGQRGNQSGHSPFAQALFKGLSGQADIRSGRKHGIITATQLYVHLRDEVEVTTIDNHTRQTPGIYPFSPEKHDKGEYIFLLSHFDHNNLEEAPALKPENNPYRGLNSYEESDAQLFFGRNKLIEDLGKLICNSNQQMTIVIGASGSGKSSLVKAGLIPYIKESEVGQQWRILAPMRPGESPFGELAKAIFLSRVNFCSSDAVNFIAEILKKTQDEQAHKNSQNKQNENDNSLAKISAAWDKASLQSKLLLIVDNFKYLQGKCRNTEVQKLQVLRNKTLDEVKKLEQDLRKGDTKKIIDSFVAGSPDSNNIKIMLVIDQFEELITLCQPEEQKLFLKFIAKMIHTYPQQLRIILTLRSDFEPQFRESDLKGYWNQPKAKFLVTAMNTEEFRQAITGPAETNMLEFDPSPLVGTLIDEVGQMPGALPLLSFALSELYINCVKRGYRTITEKDYQDMGKVVGSLTQQAEKKYEYVVGKKGVEEQTVRNVMLRMVAVSGGELARRRVTKSELEYPGNKNDQVKILIDCFTEARLLVEGKDTEENLYVEPAHDALVRGWPRLQKWIKEEQDNLILQQRLTPVANDWNQIKKEEEKLNFLGKGEFFLIDTIQNWRRKLKRQKQEQSNSNKNHHGKSTGYLWNNDPRIEQLNPLVNSDNSWLNQVENDFVRQSVIQRGKNTYRVSFIVLGVIAVLTGLTIFALIQRQTAITRQLASQGKLIQTEDNTQLQLSNLLAIESLKQGTLQPLDATQVLHQGIALLPRYISSTTSSRPPGYSPFFNGGSFVPLFAFTRDSKYLVITKQDGIALKEVATGKEVAQLNYDYKDLKIATLSADGKYAVTVTKNNTIKVWELGSFQEIASQIYPQVVNNIFLSPNGKYIVVASLDKAKNNDIDANAEEGNCEGNNVKVFELTGDRLLAPVSLQLAKGSCNNPLVFSPDGKYLAEYVVKSKSENSSDNIRRVWEIATRKAVINSQVTLDRPESSDENPNGANARNDDMVFSPDGKYFAASIGAKTAEVWPLSSSIQKFKRINVQVGIHGIALSPNGKYLAVGDQGGNLKIIEVSTGKEFASMIHSFPTWIGKVAFSPDGKYIAAVGWGNHKLVIVYEVPEPSLCREKSCQLKETARMIHEHNASNLVFSPSGKYLATEEYTWEPSEWRTVKVWEATSPPEVLRTEINEHLESISWANNGLEIVAYTNKTKITKRVIGDLDTGQESLQIQPRSETDYVEVSPEKFLISDSQNNLGGKNIKLIGRENAKPVKLTPEFLIRVSDCSDNICLRSAFKLSSRGEYLVGFGGDEGGDASRDTSGVIKLWEVSRNNPQEIFLQTFPRVVYRVIFSPDEKYFAAVIGDGTSRIWDLSTRPPQEIERLQFKDIFPQEIAFSPDGKHFVTASNTDTSQQSKGIVQVWLRRPKDLTTEACKRLSRNLTPDEWQQYLGTGNPIIDPLFSWLYQIFPTCPKLGISEIEQKGEITRGDKILVPTAVNPDKQAGVEAIAAGNFTTAIKHLEASLKSNPNDPEAKIYLNNAQIGNQKSYTIAVSVPISDINGSLEILRGVAQAQDDFNKWAKTQQGIIPIQVLIADDRNDPKIAQEIAKQLANNPDVLGVVGHFSSSVTREASQVYNDKKLVAISPVSTSVQLSDVLGKYVFRTVPNDKVAAEKLADYTLNSLKKQKTVLFYNSQSEYSCSLASEFTTAFSGEIGKQLERDCSKYGTSSATSAEKQQGQILKEIDLSNPDFDATKSLEGLDQNTVLVLLADTSKLNQSFEILKANKGQLPILAGDDLYGSTFLEKAGKQALGMVVAIPWHIENNRESRFSAASKNLWGDRDINWRTVTAYDAAKALIAAIKQHPDRKEIAKILHSNTFPAQGAIEPVQFLPSGDREGNIIELVKIQPGSNSGYGYDFVPVENNTNSNQVTKPKTSK
ncbi:MULTISPECIES: nSTAND1 domain-containing NTPase [unclassified Microcoleus]|uniref:nSTAND1 domain-containing NTPase n=1 Tax=unclassified Microcoleus TaxID=2642155 RepID=UPI002FD6196A